MRADVARPGSVTVFGVAQSARKATHLLRILVLVWAATLVDELPAAAADDLVGHASVTDGDTIKINGERIRLVGIDAPEMHQSCKDVAGRNYDCGVVSAAQLRAHIASKSVSCRPEGTDRYGRTLAVCFVGSEDLNAWLVTEGLAVAYRHYSVAYVPQEDAARTAHRGLWAGSFTMPWDWRKAQ
jgi:endonuclease YncB( thermonuclease family)